MSVRPAKTQISLGICPVWSESSLCAQWVTKNPSFLHADSEDSDQTGRMPRLIWVFAGCTTTLLVLSWGGSKWYCSNFYHHYSSLSGVQTFRIFKVIHTIHSFYACTITGVHLMQNINNIWAASWQNQQNGKCAQRRLRSAWASAKSDQCLRWGLNG